jgi:hypothetical protein
MNESEHEQKLKECGKRMLDMMKAEKFSVEEVILITQCLFHSSLEMVLIRSLTDPRYERILTEALEEEKDEMKRVLEKLENLDA